MKNIQSFQYTSGYVLILHFPIKHKSIILSNSIYSASRHYLIMYILIIRWMCSSTELRLFSKLLCSHSVSSEGSYCSPRLLYENNRGQTVQQLQMSDKLPSLQQRSVAHRHTATTLSSEEKSKIKGKFEVHHRPWIV